MKLSNALTKTATLGVFKPGIFYEYMHAIAILILLFILGVCLD